MGRLAARRRARRRRPRRDALRVGRLAHEGASSLRSTRWRRASGSAARSGSCATCSHCFERAGDFDVINDHSGPLGRGARRRDRDAGRAHGARAARRRAAATLYEQVAARRAERRAHLALDEPAQAAARPELDRELPERARPLRLSVPAATRRLPPLPRPHEPGQGRAPRGRGRDGGGAAAEDRREDARAEGAGVLRASSSSRTSATGSSSSARSSHGRRSSCSSTRASTLFPIEWEEPFGLVMIESMACGTPVIATRCGAVPEVIEHGSAGVIVDDYRDHGRPRSTRPTGSTRSSCRALRRGALLARADGARLRRRRTSSRSGRRCARRSLPAPRRSGACSAGRRSRT